MDMLKIENLSFAYDEETSIFDDITLTFDTTTTAIIGQNGAGKSTLVKLIKALLKQQKGSIFFKEKNIDELNAAEVAKSIGLVFQNPNDQIFKSKVIDEVMFGPLQIGMTEVESELIAKNSLEEVGLLEKANMNPYDLSLSDRKMIAIASIVAMDTDIIIFDEPTIAQDARGKMMIKKIIERLHSEGKLVITIIHDMDFVAENFERTIIMAKGKILFDGQTKEAFAQEDSLKTAKLDVPHITQLGFELGRKEIFLTIDDFIDNNL